MHHHNRYLDDGKPQTNKKAEHLLRWPARDGPLPGFPPKTSMYSVLVHIKSNPCQGFPGSLVVEHCAVRPEIRVRVSPGDPVMQGAIADNQGAIPHMQGAIADNQGAIADVIPLSHLSHLGSFEPPLLFCPLYTS